MSAPPGAMAGACRLVLAGEPPPDVAVASIVDLLVRNKVHLASLGGSPDGAVRGAWESISGHPAAAEALARETAIRDELLGSWGRVERAFRADGIRAVLFKSPRWFPSRSSNLDVLVEPARFGDAARILEALGHIRLPHYREDHKLLFRTFLAGRPSLSVHLHESVSWGKVMILEAVGVIARAADGSEEGVRVSGPPDAFAVAVAHTVFETDQVRLSDLLVAREAILRGAGGQAVLEAARVGRWAAAAAAGLRLYDAVGRAAGGPGLLDEAAAGAVGEELRRAPWAERRLVRALARGVADLPLSLPKVFSKEHMVRFLASDARRSPEGRAADIAASGWNLLATRLRLRCRPASLVTIGGIDGAGKSLAAAAVADALRLCEIPVATLWTRGGFSRLAVTGKSLLRRSAPSSIPAPGDEEAKRAFLRSTWKRRAWIWATVLEQSLSVQRVRLHLVLGRTVVADRFVGDTLADLGSRIGGEASGRALAGPASFLLGAAPRADLALWIEVPAEVAHRRKPDGGSLASRLRLEEAAGRVLPSLDAVRLDGEASAPDLAQEAVERTLRAVFARFRVSGP